MRQAQEVEDFSVIGACAAAFLEEPDGVGIITATISDFAEGFGEIRIIWQGFAGFAGLLEGFLLVAHFSIEAGELLSGGSELGILGEDFVVNLFCIRDAAALLMDKGSDREGREVI